MAFQVFKRRSRPISGEPIIGIQNKGTISLNAAAFRLLRETQPDVDSDKLYVEFLYDQDERVVGMRAAPAKSGNGYPIRKQPASESYLVTGRGFLQYHGIDTETKVRRYYARSFGDGIVGFSLVKDEMTGAAAAEAEAEEGMESDGQRESA